MNNAIATVAITAATLGITEAQVITLTTDAHNRTKAKLSEAQARPGSKVAFLTHDGSRLFVNLDAIRRPAGSGDATIFATEDEAIERILESEFDPFTAIFLQYADALEVLTEEAKFLADTLAEYDEAISEQRKAA